MIGIEIALIRGFDLFFKDADPDCIRSIAFDLGGNFSYDCNEMRATYMFEKPREAFVHEIANHHEMLRTLAKKYEDKFSCTFITSEFYLTVPPSAIESLKDNTNIDVVQQLKSSL